MGRSSRALLMLTATSLTFLMSGRPAMPVGEARLGTIGEGTAIIFSPDLAPSSTCAFYSRLGFLCIRDASWASVVSTIDAANRRSGKRPAIRTVIIESHGANGNALKLQDGRREADKRSYASVAALDERLYASGVHTCIINACNAGRLFRPEVYRQLDRWTFDRLLLPATAGWLLPSRAYDRTAPRVAFLIPRLNQLQSLTLANVGELDARTRERLRLDKGAYVISDTLIQLLTEDDRAAVVPAKATYTLARTSLSAHRGEQLLRAFHAWLSERAH
jgi:hypothetical protein